MRTLCAVLIASSVALAAPVPKAVKPKDTPLDGPWLVVAYHPNGVEGNPAESGTVVWAVEGESVAVTETEKGVTRKPPGFLLRKPAGGSAGEIDLVLRPVGGDERVLPARFQIDGDTLKLNLGHASDRPAKLEPTAGATYYEFKRETGTSK